MVGKKVTRQNNIAIQEHKNMLIFFCYIDIHFISLDIHMLCLVLVYIMHVKY